MAAVVQVESTYNPYAIGVVGGKLKRQPRNKSEAVATAKALEANGWNFSIGAAQVNRYNLAKYGLDYERAFEPCPNMQAGSKILEDCYTRALRVKGGDSQAALAASFSCYYSGNFKRGFIPDKPGQPSYVQKILRAAKSTGSPVLSAGSPSVASAMPIDLAPGSIRVDRDRVQRAERPSRVRSTGFIVSDAARVASVESQDAVDAAAGATGTSFVNGSDGSTSLLF